MKVRSKVNLSKSNILPYNIRMYFIRNNKFKVIDKNDVDKFISLIGKENTLSLLCDSSLNSKDLDIYNFDYLKHKKGKSNTVLFPNTTEQISEIMKYCYSENIAVCPQSGNTGLVAGSQPIFDEIVINMSKMNKIINFDTVSNVLHTQAGVILENIHQYLNDINFCAPIDIASKGSCMIGGNISTHAGGINVVKYGPLRNNIKGIKAVLATGEIIDCMNPLPKNNTGYDLKHLFIGSEGTLGIVSECLIQCYPKVDNSELSLLRFSSFKSVVDFYVEFKSKFPDQIKAIEFFDHEAMRLNQEKMNLKSPFSDTINNTDYFLLIEVENKGDYPTIKNELEKFISEIDYLDDAIISQNSSQYMEIWSMREMILEANVKAGPTLIYDVSLDLRLHAELINKVRDLCKSMEFTVVGFGHIGDYNLHINIVDEKNKEDTKIVSFKEKLNKEIFEYLKANKGSISAEHGIGTDKAQYLPYSQSYENLEIMKHMKLVLDRKQILNPYKLVYQDKI